MRWGPCAALAIVLSTALTAPVSAAPVPVKTLRSLNWSGYALTGSAFTGVTGTFNVPVPLEPFACLQETSVWVGLDGVGTADLLQAGVDESSFAVAPSSSNPWYPPTDPCTGRAHVYAWWEDLPSAEVRLKLPVNVGDDMTVSIFKMSPGWWALAVHDLTTGHSFALVQRYGGPQTSVEWVVETPEVMDLTPNPVSFGTVNFRDLGARANCVARRTSAPVRRAISPAAPTQWQAGRSLWKAALPSAVLRKRWRATVLDGPPDHDRLAR